MNHETEWDRKRRIEDRELLKYSRSLIKQSKTDMQDISTVAERALEELKKSSDALAKADSVLKESSPTKNTNHR